MKKINRIAATFGILMLFVVTTFGCNKQSETNTSVLTGTWLSDGDAGIIASFYYDNTVTIYEGTNHSILAQYQWRQSDNYTEDHWIYLSNDNGTTIAIEFKDGLLYLPIRYKESVIADMIIIQFNKDTDIPIEFGS
jgi:hypothetical protein